MPEENNNIPNNDEIDTSSDSNVLSFEDSKNNEDDNTDNEYPKETDTCKKKRKGISVKTLVVSIIAAIVAAVMLTYSICASIYKSMYAKAYVDAYTNANQSVNTNSFSEIDIIAEIMNSFSYQKLDQDEMMDAAIKAYIEKSGDIYATYYTHEELQESENESQGKMTGIGVNVINDTVTYNGKTLLVLNIVNVMNNSPALEVGIKAGDLIHEIEIDGKMQSITDINFTEAYAAMKGAAGSVAKISILRKSGDSFEEKTFEAKRREVLTTSVYERVYTKDSKIGVIRISTFDDTTPSQFDEAIKTLKSKGCTKFVIDLRNNPGGSLDSMEKILSFFLEKGQTFMQIKDNQGQITKFAISEVSNFALENSPCAITKEDIGKYKDLDIALICNNQTASASEIFISAFNDYKLAPIIGTKTYGKGSIQSMFNLGSIVPGMTGAISLTTNEALSPLGNSFNITGIKIDEDKNEPLSDEAKEYSIYELSDDLDNQLQKAVKFLNK